MRAALANGATVAFIGTALALVAVPWFLEHVFVPTLDFLGQYYH